MNVKQLFPSKYVQASDLGGRDATVQIVRYGVEKVGDEQEECPVLYFAHQTKGFVMNKTNANSISALYGDELERWVGQCITLYPSKVAWKGEMVDCIRVRDSVAQGQPAYAPQQPPPLGFPGQPVPMLLPPGQQHYVMQPPPLPAGYPPGTQYAPQQPPPLPTAAPVQQLQQPIPGPIPW